MSNPATPVLGPSAIGEEFRLDVKAYGPKSSLEGVRVLRLARHVDDRGFLQEIYRAKADHPGSEALADFFRDVPVAQINYTVVRVPDHVQGASLSPQAALVFGGVLQIHGVNGICEEPLSAFFKGPGRTTLKPGDIVTAIHLPLPPKDCAGKYVKLGRNQLSDLSIVGVTALGYKEPACASGYHFRLDAGLGRSRAAHGERSGNLSREQPGHARCDP